MVLSRTADATSLRPAPRRTCIPSPVRSTAFLLASLLAVGCTSAERLSAQNQPPDEPTSIRGTVVNAVTHAPISRALVYSADNHFAILTDSNGQFEFDLPKAKTDAEYGSIFAGRRQQVWSFTSGGRRFSLMARKPGFLDDSSETAQTETSPGSEITISLMPEALVTGRVTLSTTDPAIGVNVQLFSRQVQDGLPRWMPGVSVRPNSLGEFRFAELSPGAYKLVTHELMDNDPATTTQGGQLYGFPPVYYPGVPDFAAAATINLAAGQTVEADLSLTRQPYYPVKIPVANGENNGMNVRVQGQRGPGYSLGYIAEKQTIEGLLPNGNYVVEATTWGVISSSGKVNLRVAGAPTEGPLMTLTPIAPIPLEVKEEFTQPTPAGSGSWSDGKHTYSYRGPRMYLNASVVNIDADDFEHARGGSVRPPTRPNDDALVLENLTPGRYWLRLNTARGYVASATMGATDLLREPMVVGSGSTVPIEIKMRDDGAEIDGTVDTIATRATMTGNTSGLWLEHAYIYCVPLPSSPGQFQPLRVSSDGKFAVSMMAPGDYRVLAFASQQNLPYRDPEAMRAFETKGQVIHLAAGQKATLHVQIASNNE